MQIETLKLFTDLAESESFTKAAQLNEVTQSAVSQQIHALERHFNSTLIERSRKKFRLTREGQLLYEYSKQILDSYHTMQNKVQEIKNVISGTIHVSTIYSIGLHELPPYIKKYLSTHPTVKVQVEYRRVNEVYEDVIGNVVDVGLVAYPKADPRLEIVPLRKDNLVLICHPDHPFAKSRTIKAAALSGQKFIAFEPDIPTRRAIDKKLKEKHLDVSVVMEFDNIETVKRAVEINAGITLVPHNTVLQELQKGTLVEVTIEDLGVQRTLAAIYKKKKTIPPALREFINLLKSNLTPENGVPVQHDGAPAAEPRSFTMKGRVAA
ncbi:MAG: LysR family transcriptional regulator [Verrucomicrobiota bacterium]